MAKTNNLHIRIEPEVKQKAEAVLNRLGTTTAEAVTIFLNQVILQESIPFMIQLPNATTKKHKQNNIARQQRKAMYCYGIEIPDFSYDCKRGIEAFCEILQPEFKTKVISWFNQAQSIAKTEEGDSWKEEYFYLSERDWDSFERLIKESGLHLIPCHPGSVDHHGIIECGPVPPYIIGDYIYSDNNSCKQILKRRNPRFYHSLLSKLNAVFSSLTDSDVKLFEVMYDDDLESMYDPVDPNYMTSEDY
jgi:DNA-damage-inducible protein J